MKRPVREDIWSKFRKIDGKAVVNKTGVKIEIMDLWINLVKSEVHDLRRKSVSKQE